MENGGLNRFIIVFFELFLHTSTNIDSSLLWKTFVFLFNIQNYPHAYIKKKSPLEKEGFRWVLGYISQPITVISGLWL